MGFGGQPWRHGSRVAVPTLLAGPGAGTVLLGPSDSQLLGAAKPAGHADALEAGRGAREQIERAHPVAAPPAPQQRARLVVVAERAQRLRILLVEHTARLGEALLRLVEATRERAQPGQREARIGVWTAEVGLERLAAQLRLEREVGLEAEIPERFARVVNHRGVVRSPA